MCSINCMFLCVCVRCKSVAVDGPWQTVVDNLLCPPDVAYALEQV